MIICLLNAALSDVFTEKLSNKFFCNPLVKAYIYLLLTISDRQIEPTQRNHRI